MIIGEDDDLIEFKKQELAYALREEWSAVGKVTVIQQELRDAGVPEDELEDLG